MRLLDRYVLKGLLFRFLLLFAAFLMLWTLIDMLGDMDRFKRYGFTTGDILQYSLLRIPLILGEVVLPTSLLIATLWSLTKLSQANELTAMRSAGLGILRICAPYFIVGIALSLAVLVMNERLAPRAHLSLDNLVDSHRSESVSGSSSESFLVQDFDFTNESARRMWKIGVYNLDSGMMSNVWVRQNLPNGRVRFLKAESAVFQEGHWFFRNALERVAETNGAFLDPAAYEELPLANFNETPEQISSEYEISRLSSTEASKRALVSLETLRHYFSLHPDLSPRKEALLKTQFHARLASPWMCLVVMFIAIPFAIPSGRRNVFLGVAASLFIGFSYFILLRLGLSFGVGGQFPPWLAAWLPNLAFTTAGFILIQRVR